MVERLRYLYQYSYRYVTIVKSDYRRLNSRRRQTTSDLPDYNQKRQSHSTYLEAHLKDHPTAHLTAVNQAKAQLTAQLTALTAH